MQKMTLGQVVDFCIEVDNQRARAEKKEQKPQVRRMTQDEINAFLG